MKKANKAHTATVNRIAKRYGVDGLGVDGVDLRTPSLAIEVETQATLHRGLRHLRSLAGPVYLAVTNKEAVSEAMRVTHGTEIGVMDPQGNIIKESSRTAVAELAELAAVS